MKAQHPNAIAEELARFEGTWRQVSCEADGVTDPPDEFGSAPITTFAGNTYVVTLADGTIVLVGTFTLDPAQRPKAVDWTDTCGTDKEKTFPAIYAFEGNHLIFCAADEGMERPKEFRTRVGDTLRVHERLA